MCYSAEGALPSSSQAGNEHGMLLRLDESMCEMGKKGTYFAFEQEAWLRISS